MGRKFMHAVPELIVRFELSRLLKPGAPFRFGTVVAALDQQLVQEVATVRALSASIDHLYLRFQRGDLRGLGLVLDWPDLGQPAAVTAIKAQRHATMAIGKTLPGGNVVGPLGKRGDTDGAGKAAPP